ncbi:MAG: phosphoribosylformylglycinamidine cyclo-ligase [Candidatus Omnitrophica bacterium]|nr:phosphoribosylformylglycinamidine cyclo-ligase [Candidatus Omnitrophota bacterium]
MKRLSYKSAGVDIEKADRFVERIKPVVNRIGGLKGIGSFGGFFKFDVKKYRDPIFVSSTDGVGTKLKIAFLANRHDTVGIDLVAMNVNDVLCSGARPLFFLDYIATGKIEIKVLTDVVKGIANGCRQAGCALVGGETAEMPSFYKEGEYDLAGFCVGVVEKDKIIDGSRTASGDVIVGLESNGLHSNGYSLARKVFSEKELRRFSNELLRPTRIYVKPILSLLPETGARRPATIKGIAHITGGAFYGKIPRIIPKDKTFVIRRNSWRVPKIFEAIQKKGRISEKEMFTCFNMGIGMVVVVGKNFADKVINRLARYDLRSWIIGEVARGSGEIRIE